MKREQIGTLLLTSVAFFMVALDSLVVVTALPAIHRQLGAGLGSLEWTVNAFTLTFAAGIVTAAALGDRSGRRRVFTAGLALFTAASAACALAPSAAWLIAARAVQGAGAAMVMPLSLTILTAAFPPERRASMIGIWGGLGGLAIALGPVVGGAVTQGLDWHWIFWLNVPVGVLAAVAARLWLSESRGPVTRLDLPGFALGAGGAAGLIWGLVRAADTGWTAPEVVAPLAGGAVLLAGFLAWERRADAPMLPLRLFASRPFAAATAAAFLMSGSIFAAAFLVAQYLQLGEGYSPLATGLRLLPWTATPLIVAPLAGNLSGRFGARRILASGLALQAAALGWLAAAAPSGYGALVLPLIIAGIGISMALPVAPSAALAAVAPADMGKASGVNSTVQRFGAAFAIALASVVFSSHGHLAGGSAFVAGFQPALLLAAGFSLTGAVAALGVRGRPSPAVRRETPVSAEAA